MCRTSWSCCHQGRDRAYACQVLQASSRCESDTCHHLLPAGCHLLARPPACLSGWLQSFMVRYTKDGQLDGEANLQLPPITERLVEVRLGAGSRTCYAACGEMHAVQPAERCMHAPASTAWTYLDLPGPRQPCHLCASPLPFPLADACLQCELGEEDLPWYRALQGEQRAKFRRAAG